MPGTSDGGGRYAPLWAASAPDYIQLMPAARAGTKEGLDTRVTVAGGTTRDLCPAQSPWTSNARGPFIGLIGLKLSFREEAAQSPHSSTMTSNPP
jgi:hypothetical protein